jgi:uncharacterized protein (DUF427 family)
MPSGTATATLNGTTVATASEWEVVENNIYFPASSIKKEFFKPSANGTQTRCGWKGDASYYDLDLGDGNVVKDAAWYYPEPKEKAMNIKDAVAFCKCAFCSDGDEANATADKNKVEVKSE